MNKKIMEKVNEVGRFKQRAINYMYSSGYQCFDLNLNLELLHSYRFNYVVNEDKSPMFLNYVDRLTIPELGIKNSKTRVVKSINSSGSLFSKGLHCIYLILKGKKEDVDNVNTILKRLCVGLKE